MFVALTCGCRREVIYISRTFMMIYVRVREGSSLSRREVSVVMSKEMTPAAHGRQTACIIVATTAKSGGR